MAPNGKELSEDLKKRIVALQKDGIGYKKITKTLKLSCSMLAKTIQWFNRTGSTQNKPRHGRPKKLSAHAQRHIQRLCLGNTRMSAHSTAAEVEGVGGVCQCSDHTPHTASNLRRKTLLKMMHKKARKQFAEDKQTKDMDYWNHVLLSDETKLVQMVSSVCGGNQVRSTKTSVSCLQSRMVVGVSGAAWVLPALGSYSSLREPWMPTCTVTYWSRAWSHPFGDWAAGQYSNIITTPNTPPRRPLPC